MRCFLGSCGACIYVTRGRKRVRVRKRTEGKCVVVIYRSIYVCV